MATIRKAERRKAKLRLGISAPSGAGKTYSALLMAFGLGGKIGMIDTEHGSGDLYADLGEYDIIGIGAPYTVAKYLDAIKSFEDAGYDCQTVDFRPGDALVVFTDGVTEAENKASEEFGEERLTAFVRDLEDLPAGEVAERLMDRLNSFVEDAEQHDDITLVVLRRIGSLGPGRTPAALEARA